MEPRRTRGRGARLSASRGHHRTHPDRPDGVSFDGAADGRVRVVPAAHAPEAVSPGLLRKIRDLSERAYSVGSSTLPERSDDLRSLWLDT